MKDVKSTINANGVEIRVASSNEADYISLTDIAKYRSLEPRSAILNFRQMLLKISYVREVQLNF